MVNIHTEAIIDQIEESWRTELDKFLGPSYFDELASFLSYERSHHQIFPPENQIFNAFHLTPFAKTKVVIMGQDPYHGPNQAHGLAFSVSDDARVPASLKNIYKELKSDLGIINATGNLKKWAKQGVLLLNATLTVRKHLAGSHANSIWNAFTDSVIEALVQNKEGVIFVLWGKHAQNKCLPLLEDRVSKESILMAPHPSPFSARLGFFGSSPFSKINKALTSQNSKPIDWQI